MEAVPEKFDIDKLIAYMKSIKGIDDVHEFHLWSITTEHFSLSAHVVLSAPSEDESFNVINNVSKLLENKYNIKHTTLQIENLSINSHSKIYYENLKS